MKKYILFNPGPVNISERVRKALMKPDICHREDDFSKILQNIRETLIKMFTGKDEKYSTVMFNGSGTAGLEAAISNSVDKDETLLVINNGVYGNRIKEIAKIYEIRFVELKYDWRIQPSLSDIKNILERNAGISTVAMVHHETTTGLLNPVMEVGYLTKNLKKRFILDSISGLGGEDLDFTDYNISMLISTANKCLHGIPGLSFVIIEKKYLEKMKNFPSRNLYLNIYKSFIAQEEGETPFTPAVQVFYALEEALQELMDEGIKNRIQKYKELSSFIRSNIVRLGLKPFIPLEYMSNTISSFYMPEGRSYNNLHDYLKERGFIVYAGQGDLKGKIFRIANMGNISIEDLERFIKHLKTWLMSD